MPIGFILAEDGFSMAGWHPFRRQMPFSRCAKSKRNQFKITQLGGRIVVCLNGKIDSRLHLVNREMHLRATRPPIDGTIN